MKEEKLPWNLCHTENGPFSKYKKFEPSYTYHDEEDEVFMQSDKKIHWGQPQQLNSRK